MIKEEVNKKIDELLNEYEENCNKVIDSWDNFTKEDMDRELEYCVEYFLLMKAGDIIKCDCGDKSIPLEFKEDKVVYYKDGKASPTELDIPMPIKLEKKGCFGSCLLESPSRHPGKNEIGGNICEPCIVGTSWLKTYNSVKADRLKTIYHKKAWLACRYMGRIKSADEIRDIDVSGMTEEEAFEEMLNWVQGKKYIPQVLLDKITHIYAGGDEAVAEYWKEFQYVGDKIHTDKFDSKFIAWSKFVNNLWDSSQKATHLQIRPVLLKAMAMEESDMGTNVGYNGTINIIQSLNIGDGTLWHLANVNPYQKYTYEGIDKKGNKVENILAANANREGIQNGWVQFKELDYFDTEEEGKNRDDDRKYPDSKQVYLGKADNGVPKQSIFGGAIKYIEGNGNTETESGKTIFVIYDEQSIDMSLCAGSILLANKSNKEKVAVKGYNGDGDANYVLDVGNNLKNLGTDFIS